jgi:hypothetical protein
VSTLVAGVLLWAAGHLSGPQIAADTGMATSAGHQPSGHQPSGGRPFRKQRTAGAALGGLLGLGAFLLLWAELAVLAGPLLAAALLGPAAVGLLAAALGWLVEESPARARAVLRLSPVGLLLAAALPAAPGAALWSGPWGWAVGPTLAAAGGGGCPAGRRRPRCWPWQSLRR